MSTDHDGNNEVFWEGRSRFYPTHMVGRVEWQYGSILLGQVTANEVHSESFQNSTSMADGNPTITTITNIAPSNADRCYINVIINRADARPPSHSNSDPPKIADYCLSLFLSPAKSDAIIGDLNERFVQDCQRYGTARARQHYWGHTLWSLWPLLKRAAARAVRWGVVFEGVRRFF